MEKTRKTEILASVTMVFSLTKFYDQGKNKGEIMAHLATFLSETEYQTDIILKALTEHLKKSPNAPTPHDIIEILEGPTKKKITQEIETKWQYFQDFAFSPYNKLEDWAYDIKKTIGTGRIENFYAKDLGWLKKEFIDHVTRQINGEIEVIGDSREWVQIGNSLCLESTKKKDSEIKMIGKVLENKEEYEKMNQFKIKRYLESLSEGDSKAIKDEVLVLVRKECFNPNIDQNTKFFKSMVEATLNQVVSERIKAQESVKPKLKVAV